MINECAEKRNLQALFIGWDIVKMPISLRENEQFWFVLFQIKSTDPNFTKQYETIVC